MTDEFKAIFLDSDMLYWQRNNYLNVDGYIGLTPNICYKEKRILNIE